MLPSDATNTRDHDGLTLDPELRALIPPLSSAECMQLRDNIAANGCREPLTVWAETGILLDGHHRHVACRELGLSYQTVEVVCADREAAKDWILRNQLGRRNLSPDQASLYRGMLYNSQKAGQGGDRRSTGKNFRLKDTAEELAGSMGVTGRTIRSDGRFAEAAHTLNIGPEIVSGGIAAPRTAVIQAAEALPTEATPQQVDEAVERLKSKPHVSRNRGCNEWFTPRPYINAAVAVMGAIDCDPASCAKANETVGAATYYDKQSNGLGQTWGPNVWMNPPYAHPLIGQFCAALAAKVRSGEVKQACVLVNNATETNWFSSLVTVGSAIVFPGGRVKFRDPKGKLGAPLQGQAVVYVGTGTDRFLEHFGKFGWGARLTDRTETEGGRP